MKSIKPGRGPSMMGGVTSIFVALIGVLFTVVTAAGEVYFLSLCGVFFTVIAVWNALRSFRNATSENRYSIYDIVDSTEEPDPLNKQFGSKTTDAPAAQSGETNFCPYCGAKTKPDHKFCRSCGKKLT